MSTKRLENKECEKTIHPFSRLISERIDQVVCVVEGDSVEYDGKKFRNKKLLPYNGISVKVNVYKDSIMIFTELGKYVTELNKDSLSCKQSL